MPEFMPKLISRIEGAQTKQIVTSDYWNEIFNLLIEQGNYNTNALKDILQDGEWSLGARILDSVDADLGRTKYLKFANSEVIVVDDITIVQGLTGPVGPIGPQGNPTPALHVLGLYATLGDLETAHSVGSAGQAYAVGTSLDNTIYVWDVALNDWVDLGGITGATGAAGPGVIVGGTAGQVLTKVDGTDYNTAWTSLPSTLQFLTDLDTNVKAKFTAIDTALSNVQTSITLTASKVIISDVEGKLAASTIASSKLAHLSGVTSEIQAQIDSKLGSTAKAANSSKIDGRTVFVSVSAPAGAIDGDIWFKV